MNVVVLANAAAGKMVAVKDCLAQIRAAFAATNVAADVQFLPGRELTRAARRAVESSADVIVAAGGDGTASSVAAALVGQSKPLGILPLGTLNHFAKDLGLPLELAAAVETIVAGNVRHVDVGEVNGRTFINNSSIGIYPAIVAHRDRQRLQFGRNKWLAMTVAAMRALRRFPLLRVRLETGRESLVRTTPFVFVGNNRYQIDLLSLGARKQFDNGLLSLYVAECTSRLDMLRLAARAALGRLDQAEDFDALELPRLWVETRRRRLSVALDGEVWRLQPPLAYRSRPRALPVIVPVARDFHIVGR